MTPRQIRTLPGGIPLREPWPSEDKFFRERPDVSGLAADDDSVVINPYAPLTEAQSSAVALNEAARVVMRRPNTRPEFVLTDEQRVAFAAYGTIETSELPSQCGFCLAIRQHSRLLSSRLPSFVAWLVRWA